MRAGLFRIALALAALSGTAAHAQNASDDKGIVVTGQKEVPPKAAHRFVRQISSTVDGQLARFSDPVCPLVLGLPDQYAHIIERRIREIAANARIRVAKEKCDANVVLLIAKDADGFVKALRTRFPGLFAGVDSSGLRRAFRDGPVHAWNTIEVRNEDNQRVSGVDEEGHPTLEVKSASFITLPTQQVTVQSIVVMDTDAVVGKSLTQLADYLAMRTLAGARPPKDGVDSDTILTLFDPGAAPPPGLTQIDRNFLEGLYHTRGNATAVMQMGTISRHIVKNSRGRGD